MPEPRPSRSSFQTYLFIALVAVELLMSFTFLGYLHVQPISITFAYIPPILAGCLLGPVQATVLGAVFGLASLFKASSSYVMPMDQLFSPFRSGAPMASLILSVGTRTLFALLIGLALLWCRKRRHPRLWMILPAALAEIATRTFSRPPYFRLLSSRLAVTRASSARSTIPSMSRSLAWMVRKYRLRASSSRATPSNRASV